MRFVLDRYSPHSNFETGAIYQGGTLRGCGRARNIVERHIGWIKNCRRLASRYEKHATSFLAMVKLLFIRIYLPIAFPDTA